MSDPTTPADTARSASAGGARPGVIAPTTPAPSAQPSALGPQHAPLGPWPFRFLLAGTVFNQMAFWMQQVGVGWLILELTGSSTQIGIASFLRGLPMLVVSPFAGVVVDRLDRRRITLVSQAITLLASLALALLILSGRTEPWHVFAFTLLTGAAVTVNFPARQAMIPFVAGSGSVGRAVAAMTASQNGARVIAPGLGGLLISVSGVAACFFGQVVAFGAAWVSAFLLPTPPRSTARPASVMDTMLSGFRHILARPRLSGLLLLAVVPTVLAMPYQALLPVFARDIYDVGPGGLGLLLTANSTGAFVGALVATRLADVPRRGLTLLASGIALGLSLLVLVVAASFVAGLAALALCGAAFSVYNATNNALIHEATTDAYRGRVMSIYLMTWSTYPLATLPAGWVADQIGAPATVGWGGALCALCVALVWLAIPALRGLR